MVRLSTAALAVSSEVKHGMRRSAAARRISNPSFRTDACWEMVLTMACTSPCSIASTTSGCPSPSLRGTAATSQPKARTMAAVPSVA